MPEKMVERNRKSQAPMNLDVRRDERAKPDSSLRLFIYRHFFRKCKAPSIAVMVKGAGWSRKQVDTALRRLCESHAFVILENGGVWRAGPFSAAPAAVPVAGG